MTRKRDIALAALATISILASGSIVIGQNFKLEARPRLIGFGCGDDRQTLAAVEEGDFDEPCQWIEPVEEACRIQGESVEVQACIRYWGDGW